MYDLSFSPIHSQRSLTAFTHSDSMIEVNTFILSVSQHVRAADVPDGGMGGYGNTKAHPYTKR